MLLKPEKIDCYWASPFVIQQVMHQGFTSDHSSTNCCACLLYLQRSVVAPAPSSL